MMALIPMISPFGCPFRGSDHGYDCSGSANVIGGSVCILKTAGSDLEEMVLDPEAGVRLLLARIPNGYMAS